MQWNNLIEVLNKYAQFFEEAAKNNMKVEWDLRNNFDTIVSINGSLYEVSFRAPDYWKYANYGRRPGKMPPINVIRNWISKRRILPDPNRGVPNANSLAYVIARKIGRDGVKPTNFAEKAQNYTEDRFRSDISEAISKDISAELQNFIVL